MTTIKIGNDVKKQLAALGAKGDTYNEIVERLLASHEAHKLCIQSKEKWKTATIDIDGKASISRTLAGKEIEWRMKE